MKYPIFQFSNHSQISSRVMAIVIRATCAKSGTSGRDTYRWVHSSENVLTAFNQYLTWKYVI